MMQRRHALLLAFALPALTACNKPADGPPLPPRPVIWTSLQAQQAKQLRFAGTVESQLNVDLGFRVIGRLVSREVEVGQAVAKGAVLARIDPSSYRFALEGAQADLAGLQAQYDNALSTERRQRELAATRSASRADLENATYAREAAQAKLEQARASLMKAGAQLDYSTLIADFNGVITRAPAAIGKTLSPGETVVTLADPLRREAVVDVPESIAQRLPIGARALVAIELKPDLLIEGIVRTIAPTADRVTRTRRVRVDLIQPPLSFRLGTTVRVDFPMAANDAMKLPRSALINRDGTTNVWILGTDGKTVSMQPVTVTDAGKDFVDVVAGLDAGTRVVVTGAQSLQAGQPVRAGAELRLEGAAR